jgi:hypothetical protein
MSGKLDLSRFKSKAKLSDRYVRQLARLSSAGIDATCIEEAVGKAVANLAVTKTSSLVIYGEPQSGKTEMMICLTAKLLDKGHATIVHLMNDSVDLLTQNLKRFRVSGLAPAPRSLSEVLQSADSANPQELVVFCKKNRSDLEKLISRLANRRKIIVVDDEADYATPNAKINQGKRTKINELVGQLIGPTGYYVGVTATPARLDLNNTFQNDTEKWVNFHPHANYTGQDVFFPLDLTKRLAYRLTRLTQGGNPREAQDALVRFLVTAAYLNCYKNNPELNYAMLVHTSGKKQDHEADRVAIERSVHALIDHTQSAFDALVTKVHEASQKLYPKADANKITEYVVTNAPRTTLVVLNSERDRRALGDNPTEPSSPFTIIIGGNIVSRGVTFPRLLSMFFTRNVRHKLQQDTYIQRARMFGARGEYLRHFELTIPAQLFTDWHRCFVFHKLALESIKGKQGSPVWIGDNRVAIAAEPSINRTTVVFDKGEMSFGMFDYTSELDKIIFKDQSSLETLKKVRREVGNEALPLFLIQYIETVTRNRPELLAIHTGSSIAGYQDADQKTISRSKGFIGTPQLERTKFPDATHHVKIFFNAVGKAKVFYKFRGSLQFVQNLKSAP